MASEHSFSWVSLLEGPARALDGLESVGVDMWVTGAVDSHGSPMAPYVSGDAQAIFSAWTVAGFLILIAVIARMGLNAAQARGGTEQFVPGSRLSVLNFFELYVQSVFNMAAGSLSKKDARTHYWLIGGLFIYILFNNLQAVLPGGYAATTSISNNAAMALTVFAVFVGAGVLRNGMGFFKHMAGPVWWLAPLIFLIELVGLVVRPASLSLRLMGNMVGDHTVLGVMSELVPVVVPSIFLGLGIFVSFLQAFVFTLLTVIYVALSVAHDDDHH